MTEASAARYALESFERKLSAKVSAPRILSKLPSVPEILIQRRRSQTPLQRSILPINWTSPACKTRNGSRTD